MNDSIPKPDRYSHPGKAGRKPKPSTLVSRALAIVDKELPAIFEALIQKAKNGDREAQIYLIDRCLGRPKQETDLRVKGIIAFTAEDYELLTRPKADETRLIAEYSQVEQEEDIKDSQLST